MTTLNRAMAMQDIVESLQADARIPTVIDGWVDIDQCVSLPKPVVCVFPSQAQPPPLTETISGSYREDVEVTIVGYIDAQSTADARLGLAALDADITEILLADRRRGGWAFDTVKSQGTQTDEGLKVDGIDGGAGGQFGALLTGFRFSSYPLETGDENNVAHASFHYADEADVTLTLAALNTLYDVPAPLSPCDVQGFEVSSTDGRFRYTGARSRVFLLHASVSMIRAAGQAAVEVFLARNGTAIDSSRMSSEVRNSLYLEVTTHTIATLSYNDEISMQVRSSEATGDIQVDRLIITALPKLA